MRAAIILWCVGVVGLLSGTPLLHAQGEKGEKKAEPKGKSLEAKAREGARLELEAKMAGMQAEVYAALASEKEAEIRAMRAKQLLGLGAASEEDYRAALQTLVAMRTERAEVEKNLKLLAKDLPVEPRPKK